MRKAQICIQNTKKHRQITPSCGCVVSKLGGVFNPPPRGSVEISLRASVNFVGYTRRIGQTHGLS